MRGYVSMVGDLFHVGHINLVRAVRELGYDVLVGVHSDEEVEGYKRTPVMTMDERVAAVGACKYVAEVIPAAPTIIDESFINKHSIDMVFHGHTQEEDHLYHDMFQVPMDLHAQSGLLEYQRRCSSSVLKRVRGVPLSSECRPYTICYKLLNHREPCASLKRTMVSVV